MRFPESLLVCRSSRCARENCLQWLYNSLISIPSKAWSSWMITCSPAATSPGMFLFTGFAVIPPPFSLSLSLSLSVFFWTTCSWWLCVCVHCSYQASRDDLSVFAALRHPVPAEFVNISRWHSHIAALVGPRCVILFAVVCSCLIISWSLLLSDGLPPGKGEATYGEICRGAKFVVKA